MNATHLQKIAQELSLKLPQVHATAELLEGGGTVPFIARYRKEATGLLDEVAITSIRDRLEQLAELDARRESILKSLEERQLLTESLQSALAAAETLATLEDIYLPYRPKKRTRAMIAKEQGLEPLADQIWAAQESTASWKPQEAALAFVDPVKKVDSPDVALAGARDILAERFNDDAAIRAALRELFARSGILSSKVMLDKEKEGIKFKDYFDWSEPLAGAPSHRILAIRRGENESILYSRIQPGEDEALALMERFYVKGDNAAADQVYLAVQDCYKRLLSLSMETEARMETKKRADLEAIRIFAENLRELLLAPALGQKNVLALDPGFRTGCKLVCLNRQGKLLHHDVVFPDQGASRTAQAAETIRQLVSHYQIEAIAIGNGTAGRETEAFVRQLGLPSTLTIVMVNESGASIYSASEAAREEFPDQDLTVRGSVSIGRRLMDPLAELVKLDPKSIGVGQYQHDVDQHLLKASLDDVVVSCVNRVGVEVNTASKQLLTYVSGLNSSIAENMVAYRNEHGPFRSRKEFLEVSRLGPKTFEQAAGFLRISDAPHPLDASAVHPESYPIVDAMARDLGCSVKDLMTRPELRAKLKLDAYITPTVGLPTLRDIVAELAKPGRDPRQQFEAFSFAEGISKIEDVQPGMRIPGIVTNVTAFGAFVDIGVHQDGLVHISQVADHFVKNPADVLKVHQHVEVTVLEVDLERKRISLSLKRQAAPGTKSDEARAKPGEKPGEKKNAPAAKSPPRTTGGLGAPSAEGWFSAALKQSKKGGL